MKKHQHNKALNQKEAPERCDKPRNRTGAQDRSRKIKTRDIRKTGVEYKACLTP